MTAPGSAPRVGAALAFDGIRVQYAGRPLPALQQVTFTAHPGLVTAVVGPNGSGKSSLVRTLLRRAPVIAGRVLLDDRDIAPLDARALAQQVAIVTQREEPGMPLFVREFVMLGRHACRGAFGAPSDFDRALVEESLVKAGIADAIDRTTDSLSGGEWQRVRIARALAQDTRVLVLDEPTTFLDIAHEMAVFELVDALAKEGRTVLLVSHQLNLVARFAEHIVLLDHGRVAAAGDVNAVMRGEILEAVYNWPLVVTRDPAVGVPALLPLRGRGRSR
ncbi:ABC transporter ATP-binding protein [Gemmatimonas sp.]|jgi:iron complex transport system ATP-binding protein|uniref:ABC transporter ATP-binding protein n=1 Tax=Gemmatimonas sp. TaxID=1962908 RepID=UPI0037BE816F